MEEMPNFKQDKPIELEANDPLLLEKVITEVEQSQLKGETTRSPGTEFGFLWRQELKNNKFLALLKGKRLVDLGSGDIPFSTVIVGAAAESLEIDLVDVVEQSPDFEIPKKSIVKYQQGDILRFISKLPNDYGNFQVKLSQQ